MNTPQPTKNMCTVTRGRSKCLAYILLRRNISVHEKKKKKEICPKDTDVPHFSTFSQK